MKRSTNPKKQIDITVDEFKSRIKKTDLNNYFIFGSIILVLAMGLYAIFSPDVQNSRLANPACGKIVVAADGASMNANVAPNITAAPYFLVVNPLSNKLLESVRNPYVNDPKSQNDVAYLVAGKGEEAVIAGHINQSSDNIFTQFGIRSYAGYSGQVNDAVNSYRQARLAHSTAAANQRSTQGANQIAFGLGSFEKQVFVCPMCNWRFQTAMHNNQFPFCPNCGSQMARNMSTQQTGSPLQMRMPNPLNTDIFGVANTNNAVPGQPKFWAGSNSQKYFICPNCNWRNLSQADPGQYPRCPNCKAFMARGGAYQPLHSQPINANPVAFTTQPVTAPPIPADAHMPHAYRGVCSNCHHIMKPSSQATVGGATPVAFGTGNRGTCVIR